MTVREINVITKEETQRDYTQDELDRRAEGLIEQQKEWAKETAVRLDSDIEAILDIMIPSDIAKLPQDLKDRYNKRKAERAE